MIGIHELKVSIATVIYFLTSAAVPIYNKHVFTGGAKGHGLKKYNYPIATAFLQLGSVALVCSLYSIASHLVRRTSSSSHSTTDESWLFGPHILYKLRHAAPVGLLFGVKYGITNWGLALMPTGMHLLLQSTDLIWTVLIARVINKETLSPASWVAAILCSVGSVMIGMQASTHLEAPLLPLLVNCLTPIALALCVTTLRSGTKELFDPNNRLNGSMSAAEFTALKLWLSALVAFCLSLVLETDLVKGEGKGWFENLHLDQFAFILLGAIFVLIFQVNITWLAGLTSAVTVGIVGGVKVVPQWLLNALFQLKVDLQVLNVSGALLIMVGSLLYAASEMRKKHKQELSNHGDSRNSASLQPLRNP